MLQRTLTLVLSKQKQAKRDQLYDQAVVAADGDFDATWDRLMDEYLSAGGQDIMDERAAKWEEFFGDADMLP